MTKTCSLMALSVTILSSLPAHAEQIIASAPLINTENAVFTDDGRYFVAGTAGIHEIKTEMDTSPECMPDSIKGYSICTVASIEQDGETCQYLGMTSDGTYLYASCAIYSGGAVSQLAPPAKAALVRVLPGEDGNNEVTMSYFDTPVWYNGMTMLDDKTILASSSLTGSLPDLIKPKDAPGAAVDKIDILDHSTLTLQVSPWLDTGPSYLMPNGLGYDGQNVYYIGGQNVFRVSVNDDGSAGTSKKIFQTSLFNVLDDLTFVGDQLAIAEISMLGNNSITFINKKRTLRPKRIPTGKIQLSSLMVDPGLFGSAGTLIGTSFFQGGIHTYPAE